MTEEGRRVRASRASVAITTGRPGPREPAGTARRIPHLELLGPARSSSRGGAVNTTAPLAKAVEFTTTADRLRL